MKIVAGILELPEACTEIANEYENRQRDQGYTQEQVRAKWNNKTN